MPQNPGREGRHGEMMGQGSGFFISSDGYAVTNNHVVDGADKVESDNGRRKDLYGESDRHGSAHGHRVDQGRARF